MKNLYDLLDSSWIANILSISFTLVIFLLGIPIIFIQTYVPEDLRKYYVDVIDRHKKYLNRTAILLLLIILFIGNHGVKFFIIYFFEKKPFPLLWHDSYLTSLTADNFIVIDYIFSLIVFLFISWFIYKIFSKTVFRKENIYDEILNKVFSDVSSNGQISEDKISELLDLSTIYITPIERMKYLEKINSLIAEIVRNSFYKGEESKVIFVEILYPIFIKDYSSCNYKSVNNIINTCLIVSQTYESNDHLTTFDYEVITQQFLPELCFHLINNENISLARKCINVLKKFDAVQSIFFRIYFLAFERKVYSMVVEEINELRKFIGKNDTNAKDYREKITNYIAYISFFYCGNQVMKEASVKWIQEIASLNLTIDDFNKAKKSFVKVCKFDTAFFIDVLTKDLPTLV